MESACITSCVGVISVLLCAQMTGGDSEQQYTNYNKLTTCKLKQRLDNGLAHRNPGEYPSLVTCAAACQDNCCAVSLDEHNVCYHHVSCAGSTSCTSKDLLFEMYIKNPCEHNGMWDRIRLVCKCTDGWVGDRCERYPRNCKEMSVYGYVDAFQILTILQPENVPQPFPAYCSYYKNKKEFFTYILYNTGEYDNTLTWSDYVNGFNHDSSNYWLGLDKIKLLNDIGHTSVSLRLYVNVSGTTKLPYYYYTNFSIGAADTGYRFTASAGQNNLEHGIYGDCLTPVVGVPFSTADRDNDLDTANCARDGKAGWWFKTCTVGCNPLGPASYWRMTNFNLDRNIMRTYMYFKDV